MKNLRSLLAEEGLSNAPRVAGDDPDPRDPNAQRALDVLCGKLNLPKFRGLKTQTVAVPVPKGFSSLFAQVDVELRVSGTWGRVGWAYTHPNHHGSNGLTVGEVFWEERAGKWAWRISGSRESGLVG